MQYLTPHPARHPETNANPRTILPFCKEILSTDEAEMQSLLWQHLRKFNKLDPKDEAKVKAIERREAEKKVDRELREEKKMRKQRDREKKRDAEAQRKREREKEREAEAEKRAKAKKEKVDRRKKDVEQSASRRD